ncbi:hypothetical protein [Saccharopolyspora gregorii]|uniref:Thiolase N-terminal domain-containing protein n=1 Tax=Saccharopolyspora gregorii TaxID=33914 RepID=A0ABP6S323_9PSEU
MPGTELTADEGVRADSSVAKLAKLKPAFREGGTSPRATPPRLNDGAAALLIGSEAVAADLGVTPLARIAGRGVAGVDPDVFGIGPVAAAERPRCAARASAGAT